TRTPHHVEGLIWEWDIENGRCLESDIGQTYRPFAGVHEPVIANVDADNLSGTESGHGDTIAPASAAGVQAGLVPEPVAVKPRQGQPPGKELHRFLEQVPTIRSPEIAE